ncbi:hypothetical protein E2F48_11505 [Arthrobacter crusticola]|uniref:Heme peroxidase n=1 Tax=Arthrobacter crusticola TaxID=2547960 RepID=A0A4R5TXC4_9MICC|nr:hypothetical protein [Arthrobacter crusticola]TDK25841.1 hypothetical protein E2F48_11505 [Arthrobacter crusticola]
MTSAFTAEAEKLTEVCRDIFGGEAGWITADGYPHSLALCVIDSIYSTGSNYQSVINVVNEYREYRRAHDGDANQDGTKELLATFQEAGDSAAWAEIVNNRKPAHTKANAPLKAEVIRQAAEMLQNELGYLTLKDLHRACAQDENLKALKDAWLDLPSQRSGVTHNYLLILAGFQSVKPDRMVTRFIEEHIDLGGRRLTPSQAAELIKRVAELYPTQAQRLDHVIWRHVSGREVFREEEVVFSEEEFAK